MIFTLLLATTTLVITWIMAQTPSLASPSTPLGVRVPKTYLSDPAVASALAGFKIRTWSCGIVATVLSLFAWKLPLLAAVPSLVVTLGGLWSYISQRRRIIAAKKAGGWFDEVETSIAARVSRRSIGTPEFHGIPTPTFPWITMLSSLLAIAAGAIIVASHWSAIPDPVPVHWNESMEVDNWSDKSIRSVFSTSFVALAMLGLFAIVCSFIAHSEVSPRSERTIKARLRNEANLAVTNTGTGVLTLLISVGMAFIQVTSSIPHYQRFTGAAFITMLILAIGGSIGLVVFILYKQSQISEQLRGIRFPDEDKESPDNDHLYKWGVMYYNPDDPAVLVDKRFGTGMSFNYARWQAKVILSLSVLILVGSVALPLILN
ncbi:DUF5808 domain-containing protein [Corynebacterium marquesiae]|uniref:DUF5808 domain-containing protein n=1 Tax=Corynebacterium marquesiae TaxID=2913503 RepID=UPI00254BF400|nr:DUF5808 domain-containing protein [Corynebacterium marquesiae]MDK8455380.1 DUF5808 domain-containing protein [Corynebacterium marquesiae]MDK8531923.1 DUF5808 domain-containing protein [Corynebacterium marquesiae]MDK8725521.1 DUF5808 domain-containing protein [Corynebacterium marquesiae]MDK8770817.1 DUF5808 domain-containing protein [Corynebacterium marquesiae]